MREKKLLNLSYLIYYIILIIGMIVCYRHHNMDGFAMSFVAIFTPCLAPIALKIVGLHSTTKIFLVNVIFAFIASIVGSVWGAYSIPLFDKFLHTTSGILITLLAYMIYTYLKKGIQIPDKNEQILSLLFIFSFNMMIAVFWEFFEFLMLVLINNDGINHYTTGVYDSMTDMIVAMIGSFIPLYYVIKYYKTSKKNLMTNLTEEFLQVNMNSEKK